jgi:hypothetical protein
VSAWRREALLALPEFKQRSRVLIVLAFLAVAAGCTKTLDDATMSTDAPQSVCALPTIHRVSDGKRVQIRGRFDVHEHGVFLRDEKCPGAMLTLRRTGDGPDVTLCSPQRLLQEFGCPGGNDNGPMVTVVGILKPSKSPRYGEILVTEMHDFENVRTGERFTP